MTNPQLALLYLMPFLWVILFIGLPAAILIEK